MRTVIIVILNHNYELLTLPLISFFVAVITRLTKYCELLISPKTSSPLAVQSVVDYLL